MNLRFKAPLLVATAAGVVFVCTGYACKEPVTDPADVERQLAETLAE